MCIFYEYSPFYAGDGNADSHVLQSQMYSLQMRISRFGITLLRMKHKAKKSALAEAISSFSVTLMSI